jgi:flagellar basal-body rod modification protein FlgD
MNGSDLIAAATRVSQSLGQPSAATSKAAASGSGATSTTGTTASAGTISSNDFLSLLVTEMKNQDPTQPTDPNAYIQQLVGVNSLQQLIAINQELGAATAASGSGTSGSGTPSSSSVSAVAATPSTNNTI